MGKHALAPPDVNKRCLNREQAAEYLSISLRSIDHFIQSGTLPTVKFHVEGDKGFYRRVLIDVRDLDRLIENSKIHDDP